MSENSKKHSHSPLSVNPSPLTPHRPIPYGRQNITQEDIQAVVEALQSEFLTQGPKVKEFEDAFAQYVDAKYAVAVSNATAGLHIATLALGLKPGERVITTPITFAASANCIRYGGGEVWFADIDPNTYLISIEKIKELIESKPKGFFKGIIPVDFAGLPVDMEQLRNLAVLNDLWIIEDACHAPGAFLMDSNGKEIKAGSNHYSDCTVFSFHPVKHIACGEGGMVTTNSEEIYHILLSLRSHGITKNSELFQNSQEFAEGHPTNNEQRTTNNDYPGWYYEMTELGYNNRLTDIQAALGITQLAKNHDGVIRRNEIARKYQEAFEGKIKYQHSPENTYNAYHLFVIEVKDRKGLYETLRSQNIFTQIHYIPCHLMPYYRNLGWREGDLPYAEAYYTNCLSLPMFPSLTNEEQEYVINCIIEFHRI